MCDDDVELRLRRLERTNRLLFGALAASGALLAVAASSQDDAGPREVLAARAFQLVDAEGRVAAVLETSDRGPSLVIRDVEGRDRVTLTHDSEQSGLFIADQRGHLRVGAAHFAHGGGGFALHGDNQQGAAVLYYQSRGTLTFFDDEGTVVQRIPPAESP